MTRRQRNSLKTLTGLSFGGFIALLAAQGKAFFEALEAMPRVLIAMSDALPLGAASFFLVLAISGVVWFMAQRYFVRPKVQTEQHGREFTAELITQAAALLAMLALNLTSPIPEGGTYVGTIVKALMLGLLAGFAAPFLAKGMLGLARVVKSYTVGEEEEDKS